MYAFDSYTVTIPSSTDIMLKLYYVASFSILFYFISFHRHTFRIGQEDLEIFLVRNHLPRQAWISSFFAKIRQDRVLWLKGLMIEKPYFIVNQSVDWIKLFEKKFVISCYKNSRNVYRWSHWKHNDITRSDMKRDEKIMAGYRLYRVKRGTHTSPLSLLHNSYVR